MMRLAWWLDQLRKGARKRRGGTQFRCPRLSSVVECLETRTQLTGVTFLATEDPAVFELSVPQRGAVTLAIRNGDDSRFVGEVALLSPSGRVLREQQFVDEPQAVASVLTETVAPGSYRVRVRPGVPTTTAPQVELQFQATSDFSVGDNPLSVVVADVNGDGRLDLLTNNIGSDDVSVLLGDGSGDFENALGVAPISADVRPVVADVDRDGVADVVVLRGDGVLLYRPGTLMADAGSTARLRFDAPVEVNPRNPVRDFTLLQTASGVQIAAVDRAGDAVTLYEFQPASNGANPTFLPTSVAINGSLTARIVAGEFDGDAAHGQDFAVINQGTQTVTRYLATAAGFVEAGTFNTGAGPTSFATADFNGDELTDLVVPNFGSGDVSLFQSVVGGDFDTTLARVGNGPYFIGPSPYDPSRIESQSLDETSSAAAGTSMATAGWT